MPCKTISEQGIKEFKYPETQDRVEPFLLGVDVEIPVISAI